MKVKYIAAIASVSILSLGLVGFFKGTSVISAESSEVVAQNPCAGVNPCASNNPCASKNPCAGVNPCASNNPCAGANPCASKNPCAGANPCASNNPCAGKNPCAGVSNSAPKVYIESASGLAIRGTDPVAYFTEKKVVKGSSEFEYEWEGATWRFSSAENQKRFADNPEAYAPQYGGYCAKALSEGSVVSTDPEAWKIVDGKLYLNYSSEVQQQWVQDIPGNIAKADANWPDVLVGATVFE